MTDVRSFGAAGDGRTDDTASLQAAINAAATRTLPFASTRMRLPPAKSSNAWSRLAVFESRDLVRERSQVRHGREVASEKAGEVAAHVAQGRAFFSASETAPESVRPLLQYYGVLALARALVLYLIPNLREAGLSNSHGLSAINWGQTLAGGNQNVGNLRIRMEQGTFGQLLDATSNLERASVFSPPIPNRSLWSKQESRPAQGSEIAVLELVARMPDLHSQFESVLGARAACYRAFVFVLSETTHTDINVFPGLVGLPEVEAIRSELHFPANCDMRLVDTHHFMGNVHNCFIRLPHKTLGEMAAQMPMLANDTEGETFVIAPLSGGGQLSSLMKLFVFSYSLGMLARYFPTQWISMANRQTGDRIYPLLRSGSDIVQLQFPVAALREFEGGAR